jgi:hypothetical protein
MHGLILLKLQVFEFLLVHLSLLEDRTKRSVEQISGAHRNIRLSSIGMPQDQLGAALSADRESVTFQGAKNLFRLVGHYATSSVARMDSPGFFGFFPRGSHLLDPERNEIPSGSHSSLNSSPVSSNPQRWHMGVVETWHPFRFLNGLDQDSVFHGRKLTPECQSIEMEAQSADPRVARAMGGRTSVLALMDHGSDGASPSPRYRCVVDPLPAAPKAQL